MKLDKFHFLLGSFIFGLFVGFSIPSKFDIFKWIIQDFEDTLYYYLPISYHFGLSVIVTISIVILGILSLKPFIGSLFSGLNTFKIAILLCIFGFIVGKIGNFLIFN